jgi:putative transcriptional regulator
LATEQAKIASMVQKIRKGEFLVAMPILVDQNFRQTVVLLCDHNAEGSVGLVLNRPTDVEVSALLNDFPALSATGRVYAGGPVGRNAMLILGRSNTVHEGHGILKDVFLAKDVQVFKDSGSMNTDREIRCYLGYAGWAPGQLEAEMKSGAWCLMTGDSRMIFDADPTLLWQDMMRRLGDDWAVYASMPPDLSMN